MSPSQAAFSMSSVVGSRIYLFRAFGPGVDLGLHRFTVGGLGNELPGMPRRLARHCRDTTATLSRNWRPSA